MSVLKLVLACSLAISSCYAVPMYYNWAKVEHVVARLDPPNSAADCRNDSAGAIANGETLTVDASQNNAIYICSTFKTLSNKQTLYVRAEGVDSGYVKESDAMLITGSFSTRFHSTFIVPQDLAEEGEELILSGIIRNTDTNKEHKRKDIRITFVNSAYGSNAGDDIGSVGSITVTRQSDGEEIESETPFDVVVADNDKLVVRVEFNDVKVGNKLSIIATPSGLEGFSESDVSETVISSAVSSYIKYSIVTLNQWIGATSIEIKATISEGSQDESVWADWEPIYIQ